MLRILFKVNIVVAERKGLIFHFPLTNIYICIYLCVDVYVCIYETSIYSSISIILFS